MGLAGGRGFEFVCYRKKKTNTEAKDTPFPSLMYM